MTQQTVTAKTESKKPLVVGACRPLDMSTSRSRWSPTEQEGAEVQGGGLDAHGNLVKGFARITCTDGAVKIARAKNKKLFDDAERVLKSTHGELKSALDSISQRMGGSRVIPAAKYDAFLSLRETAQVKIKAANEHASVVEANVALAAMGRAAMGIVWYPLLFAELRLADPEDAARAVALQEAVAQSIVCVLSAVRSQDRDQIRTALDNVGALADSVADPDLQQGVRQVLSLAQQTLAQIKAATVAAASADRPNVTVSGRAAARQREEAAKAELARIATQVKVVGKELSRFELLDVCDEVADEERRHQLFLEGRAAKEAAEAADLRLSLAEVTDEAPALPTEDALAFEAARLALAEQAQPIRQLEID